MQNIVIHKIDMLRDFAAGVYLSEAQNHIPPSLTHCIHVYKILIHTGKGGGGLPICVGCTVPGTNLHVVVVVAQCGDPLLDQAFPAFIACIVIVG
jgi:hypothetical protein